jgi:hypothetical protein
MAISAALLIHLRLSPQGRRTLLKVAQPGLAQVGDGRLEIDNARYVLGRQEAYPCSRPSSVDDPDHVLRLA